MEGKKIERSPFRMRSRSGSSRCATAIDAAVTSEKPDERARKATWLMRGGEKNRETGALDKVMKKRTSRRRRRNRNRKGKKRRKKRRQKEEEKEKEEKKGPAFDDAPSLSLPLASRPTLCLKGLETRGLFSARRSAPPEICPSNSRRGKENKTRRRKRRKKKPLILPWYRPMRF